MGNSAGHGGGEKAYLRKAVIGGNLALKQGGGEHPAQENL